MYYACLHFLCFFPSVHLAFPCEFPGCSRTFAVRSNAKRHLRTHGVIPAPAAENTQPAPYVVDFSAPTVLHPSGPLAEPKGPLKLRWMPPSLTSRTNANTLKSVSEDESIDSDVDDDSVEDSDEEQQAGSSSIPTPPLYVSGQQRAPSQDPSSNADSSASHSRSAIEPRPPSLSSMTTGTSKAMPPGGSSENLRLG